MAGGKAGVPMVRRVHSGWPRLLDWGDQTLQRRLKNGRAEENGRKQIQTEKSAGACAVASTKGSTGRKAYSFLLSS